jgi:hypothetical protein
MIILMSIAVQYCDRLLRLTLQIACSYRAAHKQADSKCWHLNESASQAVHEPRASSEVFSLSTEDG